jgi:hypothetical protein
MRCKDCKKRGTAKTKRQRHAPASRAAMCEKCGAPILPLPDTALGAGDGTLAHLTRFGLAITGDPLLELKREGI